MPLAAWSRGFTATRNTAILALHEPSPTHHQANRAERLTVGKSAAVTGQVVRAECRRWCARSGQSSGGHTVAIMAMLARAGAQAPQPQWFASPTIFARGAETWQSSQADSHPFADT